MVQQQRRSKINNNKTALAKKKNVPVRRSTRIKKKMKCACCSRTVRLLGASSLSCEASSVSSRISCDCGNAFEPLKQPNDEESSSSIINTYCHRINVPKKKKDTTVKFIDHTSIVFIQSRHDIPESQLNLMHHRNRKEFYTKRQRSKLEQHVDGRSGMDALEEDFMFKISSSSRDGQDDDEDKYCHPVHVLGLENCLKLGRSSLKQCALEWNSTTNPLERLAVLSMQQEKIGIEEEEEEEA